jgi:hypothetical protein
MAIQKQQVVDLLILWRRGARDVAPATLAASIGGVEALKSRCQAAL